MSEHDESGLGESANGSTECSENRQSTFENRLRGATVAANTIKEGSIYKVLTAFGKNFEIRYGYYEEFERLTGEPIPIYPDFREYPLHTEEGFPFVTQMQDVCGHCRLRSNDSCCGNCRYFAIGEELIGICTNVKNKTG